MDDHISKSLDEMHSFYGKDNPTKEDQFRFEEAMEYLSQNTDLHPEAFDYNLAMHYMDTREFGLAKKHLERGAITGDWTCKEWLGIIWYYGLCGEQDFEKAYMYFENRQFGRSAYLLADMYHYGYYVKQNIDKCREILEYLFKKASNERYDGRFDLSTLYPEIALRLVRLNIEEGKASLFDLDGLYSARKILSFRQKRRASWINLKTMRSILETLVFLEGEDYRFRDIYDLMVFDFSEAVMTFDYNDVNYRLDVFMDANEIVYQLQDKWFHSPDDLLERAQIGDKRLTSIYDEITSIWID